MAKTLVEMAANIIQSQCSTKSMSSEEITSALETTFKALQSLQDAETQGTEAQGSTGAVDLVPAKSIQQNKIICLECGQGFKMLSSKHLGSHGLTGKEYRAKYGFKMKQPLCAKSLTAKRKKAGKERGIPENLKKVIAAKKKATRPKRKKVATDTRRKTPAKK